MNTKKSSVKKFGTRQITIVGMLSAASIILGSSGFGFLPLPIAKATIMHIPAIIGAILEGPIVGASVGLIFGLFSIFQNITNPNVLSFALINPFVSVLPRILIGITSYYVYKALFIRSETVKIGLSAIVGSLTNTVGVLAMIYILYAARYAEVKGIGANTAAKVIFGIAATNGIPEAIIAVLVTIPIVKAVKRIRRR